MRLISVDKLFLETLYEFIVAYRDSVLDFLELWERVVKLVYPRHNIRKFKSEFGTILKLRNIRPGDLERISKVVKSLWDHLTVIQGRINSNHEIIENAGINLYALETNLTDCFILVRKFKTTIEELSL